MVTAPPDGPVAELTGLARARALQAQLAASFARVLAQLGARPDDLAHILGRLERDPATRRAIAAARHEARAAVPHPPGSDRRPPPLPRNPRALRV